MANADILVTFHWWLTLFILGVGFLPLTIFSFKNFFDRGYLFSKILGLTITSYVIFILGLFHIVPFSQRGSIFIFLILVIACFFLLRNKQNIIDIVKQSWKTFLFEEILFAAALYFWAYIHAFSPDAHGLEKFMDFGFINSILRSDYFPPKDMWFTPLPINYYYFGHLMTAVLTKASGIPSAITFNLMLSTIFAFCFTQSFSIGANLYALIGNKEKLFVVKRTIAGIISAMLVAFAGNLHIIYAFFKAYPNDSPVPPWQLEFLPFSFPNAYWYPNATRFIYHTIHEFPIYSWTVADLHGHVLDIPVVLLIIAVLLSLFTKLQNPNNTSQTKSKNKIAKKINTLNFKNWKLFGILNMDLGYLILIGFLLAVAYMTNAWDGGIYLILTSLVLFYLNAQKEINYKSFFASVVFVLVAFLIFVTPYNSNFKPFVSGIGVLCSPDFLTAKGKIGPVLFEPNHCQHSPWWQLLILYGFFYFFVLSFIAFAVKMKKILSVDKFVFLLIILSTILIIIPEFIYVKDIYPEHYRANTMFKLVFQAFMMLSLASGYIIIRLISQIRVQKNKIVNLYSLFFVVSFSLFILVMLYPFQAVNSYYGNLQTYHGLNGTDYLKTLYPDEATAIDWLNTSIKGQPVILEAQGDSYTDYARVSANTGLPTILGWTVHEWLWRGTYDIPAPRIDEVKRMYESTDINETKSLLQKYKVQYVFIGHLEYEKYPGLQEAKFKKLGKIVFQKNNTKIYWIK